jgi:predicted ATPase/DNA-binding winged helix-turn-helix (wHTH) protein
MTDDPMAEARSVEFSGAVAYLFGSFRLIPSQQTLLDGGERVLLGGRALELLATLVERAGELVTKEELIARAWPRAVVAENNLKVHIAALRKALGEKSQDQRFIATVVGRGYRFVAPVERERLLHVALPEPVAASAQNNLPAALVRPIGRADAIEALLERLSRVPLVTVTGPGGIGKTTLALAVAREMAKSQQFDVWFVNLSRLSDQRFVPHAVAHSMGLAVHSDDIPGALANYFRFQERRQLVVLDSCEHVIEAAAAMAELLNAAAPQMRLLATSRESLQAVGEHVYQLSPLENPPDAPTLTVAEAVQYPAVELFVERARAARGDFRLSDEEAPIVARICRKLDGIALAIELAATRVDAFAVGELLELLGDRFSTLAQGRRTAPERQRTLLATLDWSHQLLPEHERAVLLKLGVFPGVFSLASATDVAGGDDLTYADAVEAIASLVRKSMVATNADNDTVRYRLLDTTRDYARRKLIEAGDLDKIARRHAEHFRDLYARAEDKWNRSPGTQWLSEHLGTIDDLRSALDWAFSVHGDTALGIALTVSAIPAWIRMSSLDECRTRVEQALHQATGGTPALDRQRMRLYAALAASALYTRGRVTQVDSACASALAIAEQLDDKEYQLRSLFVACCGLVYSGAHGAADELLMKFRSIAKATHNDAAMIEGSRLTAFAWHHMGRQADARSLLNRVLERYDAPDHRPQLSDNHVKGREGTRSLMASVLWFQGCFGRAIAEATQARSDAEESGHILTIGYVLVFAFVPIALLAGDLDSADTAMISLQDTVAKHGLALFDAMTQGLRGALMLERNNPAGLPILADALAQLDRDHIGMRYTLFAAIHARGLLRFGRSSEARSIAVDALAWARAHDELWCVPELMRIHAETHTADDELDTHGAAEALYANAIELSRQQDAQFLELRAANSLAVLRLRQGKPHEAQAALAAVLGKLEDESASADLSEARALFGTIRSSVPRSGSR